MCVHQFKKGDEVIPLLNKEVNSVYAFSKNCIFQIIDVYGKLEDCLVKVKILQGSVHCANSHFRFKKGDIMSLYSHSIQLLVNYKDNYKIF